MGENQHHLRRLRSLDCRPSVPPFSHHNSGPWPRRSGRKDLGLPPGARRQEDPRRQADFLAQYCQEGTFVVKISITSDTSDLGTGAKPMSSPSTARRDLLG